MSILEKAKDHFRQVLGEVEYNVIDVPEWECKIYVKPRSALNVKEMNGILEASTKRNIDGLIQVLIVRALDETGKNLFTGADKVELRRASPSVIANICDQIAQLDIDAQDEEARLVGK